MWLVAAMGQCVAAVCGSKVDHSVAHHTTGLYTPVIRVPPIPGIGIGIGMIPIPIPVSVSVSVSVWQSQYRYRYRYESSA